MIGDFGTIEGNAAANAEPPIEAGDVVVEVNGTPIETDIDLRRVLARDFETDAEFVLKRTKKEGGKTEIVRTKVAPNPMRRLGFSVGWLPISAIKNGSPAQAAGLNEGDEIIDRRSTARRFAYAE